MTVLYFASDSSVNTVESSVASTENPRALPSWRTAATPAGIESCLKPAVFEKTRTENVGVTGEGPPVRDGDCWPFPHPAVTNPANPTNPTNLTNLTNLTNPTNPMDFMASSFSPHRGCRSRISPTLLR